MAGAGPSELSHSLFHLYSHSLIQACLSGLPAYSRPIFLLFPSKPDWKLHTLFSHHGMPWSRKASLGHPYFALMGPSRPIKKKHCMYPF